MIRNETGWTGASQDPITVTSTSQTITGSPGCFVYIFESGDLTQTTREYRLAPVMPSVRELRRLASLERLGEMVREGKKPAPPLETMARHGFQQMCRIPCYRGVRTR